MNKKYFLIIMINTASMTIFCADKPIRGGSGGTSIPSAPRGSITDTTQRSWLGSLFQRRPVKKVILRPEETVTVYRDMNADPGIDAYSGMTNASSILYPTKETISAQNALPSDVIETTTYYPKHQPRGKEVTIYGGRTGYRNKVTAYPAIAPGFLSRKWSDFMNWWNSR